MVKTWASDEVAAARRAFRAPDWPWFVPFSPDPPRRSAVPVSFAPAWFRRVLAASRRVSLEVSSTGS